MIGLSLVVIGGGVSATRLSAARRAGTLARDAAPYPHGDYEQDCVLCHSPAAWKPVVISKRFKHEHSGFALDGAHRSTNCRACHSSLQFADADGKCVSCHLDVHQGELGTDCASCHDTDHFVDRPDQVRDHDSTRFALTGAHRTVECAACHPGQPEGGLRFVGTSMECESCHIELYRSTRDPDHAALDFDSNCSTCHATSAWTPVSLDGFDHAKTGFALAGSHGALDCSSCHEDSQYSGRSSDCISCHRPDYESTTSPDHVVGGLPADCTQCHAATVWTDATFDHGAFSLTGKHGGITCQQCHSTGSFQPLPADCVSCHQTDFMDAPSHVASSFSQDCESCHGGGTWDDVSIDHDFFPLTGGHGTVACEQCHISGSFDSVSADCISCHPADYQAAPGHLESNFPLTCESCHTVVTWAGADFAHDQFPLAGGHLGLQCINCHTSGTC